MSMCENKVRKTKEETWQPRIVAFLSNWCDYMGADLAGVCGLKCPPTCG